MNEVLSKPCIVGLSKNHVLPEETVVDNGNSSHNYHAQNRVPAEADNSFYSEQTRLETFKKWPVSYIKPEALAKSGFIYRNVADNVICVFCAVEIGDWEMGDDPHVDHKKWSPGCPFIKGRAICNVPITHDPISTDRASSRGHDTCGSYGIERRLNSYADNDRQIKYYLDKSLLNPKYPYYSSIEKRKQTYGFWPVSLKQRPEELVEAGFYYTGQGDRTICYFCGLGLNLWQEDDIPWEQHARWSPKCAYLLNKKPQTYVDEITNKFSAASIAETESVPTTPAPAKETKPALLKTTEEEPTKENEKTMCKICFSKEIGVVFLPCGHMVACVDCASVLTTCAVCRQKLEGTLRAYLS